MLAIKDFKIAVFYVTQNVFLEVFKNYTSSTALVLWTVGDAIIENSSCIAMRPRYVTVRKISSKAYTMLFLSSKCLNLFKLLAGRIRNFSITSVGIYLYIPT